MNKLKLLSFSLLLVFAMILVSATLVSGQTTNSCSSYNSCSSCTSVYPCGWSTSLNTCLTGVSSGSTDHSSTGTDWTWLPSQCSSTSSTTTTSTSTNSVCSAYSTCTSCLPQDACGWDSTQSGCKHGNSTSSDDGQATSSSGNWFWVIGSCPTQYNLSTATNNTTTTSNSATMISNYPLFLSSSLVDNGQTYHYLNAIIVLGSSSSAADNAAAVDVASALGSAVIWRTYYLGEKWQPIVFPTEIDTEVLPIIETDHPLVLVGGPCVNSLVEQLAEAGKFPYKCSTWPSGNFGLIDVIDNAFTSGRVAMVIAGTTSADTRTVACTLFASQWNYADVIGQMTGHLVKISGTCDSHTVQVLS